MVTNYSCAKYKKNATLNKMLIAALFYDYSFDPLR